MTFEFDEQVRRCYERASGYRDRAMAERDPQLRQFLSDLEERWLNLAQSYEISHQLTDHKKAPPRAFYSDARHAIDLDRLFEVISETQRRF